MTYLIVTVVLATIIIVGLALSKKKTGIGLVDAGTERLTSLIAKLHRNRPVPSTS